MTAQPPGDSPVDAQGGQTRRSARRRSARRQVVWAFRCYEWCSRARPDTRYTTNAVCRHIRCRAHSTGPRAAFPLSVTFHRARPVHAVEVTSVTGTPLIISRNDGDCRNSRADR